MTDLALALAILAIGIAGAGRQYLLARHPELVPDYPAARVLMSLVLLTLFGALIYRGFACG